MKPCTWTALALGAGALLFTPRPAQAQVWIGPPDPVVVGPAWGVRPAWGVAPGWQVAPAWGVRRYYRPVFRTYYRPFRRAAWYGPVRSPWGGAVTVGRRWW